MIQSFIDRILTLASNTDSVRFDRDCIRTRGCDNWLCHNCGSANYDIVCGGKYNFKFNASVSSAAAGVIAFALFNNGEEIPGTRMVETLAAAGDYANIGIEKEIPVCCKGNSTISVRSIPAVADPTDPTAAPIVTQIPIIVSANLIGKRDA